MLTNWLITLFASASYIVGVSAVRKGDYKPSIYSRLIWTLLAINGMAGVIALHNSTGVITLAVVQFLGSLAMFVASWRHSVRVFGQLEWVCTFLLVTSLVVWLLFRSPIINVMISIIAHFIGGVPTFAKVWKKPHSENFYFWILFALASILAFITADKTTFRGFVYTLYFLVFDSTLSILSARQFFIRKR